MCFHMVFTLLGIFQNYWTCDNLSFIIFPKISAIMFLNYFYKAIISSTLFSLLLVLYHTNYIHKWSFYIVPHLSSLMPCSGFFFFSLWPVTIPLFFSSLMSQLKPFFITVTVGFFLNAWESFEFYIKF